MSRIAAVFTRPNHKAFIPYITVGYPSVEMSLKVVPILADCGCDIIELGIPFSDPLADGTTIQKASFQALQNGISPKLCLEIAGQLSQKVEAPLVFMTYFNPIFNYGLEEFCDACANSGIDGLIIPDMPPEEGLELKTATQRHGLDLIYLLAPTSTKERIRLVAERSRGFIYLVSVTGVTGARGELPPELGAFVARVRKVASQPLCVGFGISTPRQAKQVARIADGVIVGSQLIHLMESGDESMTPVRDFATEMRTALDKEAQTA
jgi:tryptophan synthase alpha chain